MPRPVKKPKPVKSKQVAEKKTQRRLKGMPDSTTMSALSTIKKSLVVPSGGNKDGGHTVVNAYAGTGKTFTLIVGIAWCYAQKRWKEVKKGIGFDPIPSDEQLAVWERLKENPTKTVTYCAFNKSIVTSFGEQWNWLVDILRQEGVTLKFSTINGLGHRTCMSALGRINKVNKHLVKNTLSDMGYGYGFSEEEKKFLTGTEKLAGLAKLTLAGWDGNRVVVSDITDDELHQLIAHHGIELPGHRLQDAIEAVRKVLAKNIIMARDNRVIDYNDQNWLPLAMGMPVDQVGSFLVDEAQDLPRCKQEYAIRSGRSLTVVGDVHQAVYGFAGADVDSIPRMCQLLAGTGDVLEPLKLTVTRRCSQEVVKLAQKYVPDFKAHESNAEGSVNWVKMSEYGKIVEDQDMILARVNAILVGHALKFLKQGRKVVIRGRDFGTQLINWIEKLRADSVQDLLAKAELWVTTEENNENSKKNPSEERLTAIQDRMDCLTGFSEGKETVSEIIREIDLVFAGRECPRCKKHFEEEVDRCLEKGCQTETDPVTGYSCGPKLVTPDGILFSTVHKAKGLESKRVVILLSPEAMMPHRMAKLEWEREQEFNLIYIAITRAMQDLYIATRYGKVDII